MKIGSYFVLGLSLMAGTALGADAKVEALLGHLRDSYKAVSSAAFKTTLTDYAGPQPRTLNADIDYKKPNMIRAIVSGAELEGGPATILSDGHTITISAAGGTSAQEDFTPDAIEKDIPCNLESISFWDWDRQLSTAPGKNMEKSTFNIVLDEEWNGKHWTVLEETAKKDNVLCRYFIDPKTYLIWRTEVRSLDTKKEQMDAKLTALDPNAKLSDGIFSGT